jgi:predicted O-linked N-acetylglucosamine transferase (SPINDLY family)
MLYLPAHDFPRVVPMDAVPDWLRANYFAHMQAPPLIFFRKGEADACCDLMSQWTARLRDGVASDPFGENGYRLAQQFTETAQFHPLYFNFSNVHAAFRARAELLEMSLDAGEYELDWPFAPRAQPPARLKLGIVAVNFSAGAETFATLPVYRHLDRNRFEITLFAMEYNGSDMEKFCARQADKLIRLPAGLKAQARALREADLDLLYLGSNVTPTRHGLTLLALHRLARVQVAGVCSCVTTGMRNVDCYLSGTLSEPATDAQSHYTEKLYGIDGPAHCYDFGDAGAAPPAEKLQRSDFGIPHDAIVFASGANFFKILPEIEDIWLRILAAVPGSRLVIYPFGPQWGGNYPVDSFMRRLHDALQRHGIDPQRVLVFKAAEKREEILQRLTLADIYLDSFPFSGATSLLDPLLAALPAVTLDGTSFRTLVGPAIMRSLGLAELVAADSEAYAALALRLARDAPYRAAIAAQTRAAMNNNPLIFDSRRYAVSAARAFEQMWQDYCDGRLHRA